MHIGLLAPLLARIPPSKYGGTERVMGWLADALVAFGHDVTLFGTGEDETAAMLVPLVERPLWKAGYVDQAPVRVAAAARAYEIADVELMHNHAEWAAYAPARSARFPTVTTVHLRTDSRESAAVYDEFREQPLVSVSLAQRRPLPRANWVANVPHGMPAELYRRGDGRGGYLAFLGRISPQKGVHTAIEVAHRTGLPLRIAGRLPLEAWQYPEAKEDRAYYDEQVRPQLGRDGIEFVGELDDHGKQELLGGALALLLPVDWPEPFGLVLIEAMACGTPVLARPRGSVPEIVADGITGYHCEDAAEFVAALARIDRIDRAACRRAFDERFSARRMARDYVDVYDRILREHRARRAARLEAEAEEGAR